ncbi:hypothetical protein CLV63_10865 [Murinocardiopsis flavida]|uniref:Lipocalin-like protein n=1 Tax=Murinocardiopsis flavida TaxID=645275 RepID=A0A2P8DJE9_9ACTN|nr:hypothetical protein [Murinocardiopsis flavida]PSK97347.1 hypothetical protein CLV63_10865 [Murinocardiopsis flavida]
MNGQRLLRNRRVIAGGAAAAGAALALAAAAWMWAPAQGVPDDFAGAWSGELTQMETETGTFLSEWQVTVRLAEGAASGTAELAGLHCRGRLTLTGADGDTARFRYIETADDDRRCVDTSMLVLRREGEQRRQLEADWRTSPDSVPAMASTGQLFR